MNNRTILGAVVATAVAVGSIAMATGDALAAAKTVQPPHRKPLICAFLPFLCPPPAKPAAPPPHPMKPPVKHVKKS